MLFRCFLASGGPKRTRNRFIHRVSWAATRPGFFFRETSGLRAGSAFAIQFVDFVWLYMDILYQVPFGVSTVRSSLFLLAGFLFRNGMVALFILLCAAFCLCTLTTSRWRDVQML